MQVRGQRPGTQKGQPNFEKIKGDQRNRRVNKGKLTDHLDDARLPVRA